MFYSGEGFRGLSAAVENGAYAFVAALLDGGGADVHACDSLGYTALHLASSNGNTRIVELLLDRGAVVDAPTTDDITPLACAVGSRRHDTIALLLSRGA
ncbi:ankyrin, partial [Peniophora sp. CONT]